ncbi:MAG: MraY family glycosyltransferase [Thermodesulfobacteriota bacterium]
MKLIYLAFFLLSLLGSFLLTPLVRAISFRFGILDQPGTRKVHQDVTPRLGGVVVLVSLAIPFLVFYLFSQTLQREITLSWKPFLGLSLGCLLVFSIGVWDDMRRLPPWPKLAIEIGAALVAYYYGLRIELFSNPFGLQWNVSWLSLPFTVFWLVGITNAVNLADGIDGLASGIATFAAAVLFVMTVPTVYVLVPFLAAALAGAALGFLRYNFSPATIFLGDSGSLFLGFLLGGLSLWASEKSTIAFALLIPIIALGIPILDMIYAILRRWNRGVSIAQADREHIHHKLLEKGYSHRKAVLLLYGVNLVLVGVAAILLITRNSFASYIIIALGFVIFLGSRFLGYFKFAGAFQGLIEKWKDSQQSKYLAFRRRLLIRAFEEEKAIEQRWKLVGELFAEMGIKQATITLNAESEKPLVWFAHTPVAKTDKTVYLSLPLTGEKGSLGLLELEWCSSQGIFPIGISRLMNVMANEFCRDLANNLSELSEPARFNPHGS